jgi:hypothetical protein
MTATIDPTLSRGARLCELLIRRSRPHRGGLRRCGRPFLARRLGCSTRTVSRYVAELRHAGVLDVLPPRRKFTGAGWRTIEVNGYLVRRHRPSSHRDDKHVPPPPTGSGRRPHQAPSSPALTGQSDGASAPTPEYLASRHALRAQLAARRRSP